MSTSNSDPSLNPQPEPSEVQNPQLDAFLAAKENLLGALASVEESREPGDIGIYADQDSGTTLQVEIASPERRGGITVVNEEYPLIAHYPLPSESAAFKMGQRIEVSDDGSMDVFSEGWLPGLDLEETGHVGDKLPTPESLKRLVGDADPTRVVQLFIGDRYRTNNGETALRRRLIYRLANGQREVFPDGIPYGMPEEKPLDSIGPDALAELAQLFEQVGQQVTAQSEHFTWQSFAERQMNYKIR